MPEKTRTHESHEQSDDESVSNDESVRDDIVLPDKDIRWKMSRHYRTFSNIFLLPSQNLIKIGVNKVVLERSKRKPLRTCPGEGC